MCYYRNILRFAIMSVVLLLLSVSCSDNESPVSPDYDHRPPNVEWIAPTSGSELSGEVEISFNAFDDIGLDSVKLYVNGALSSLWDSHFNPSLDTDTTFTFSWNTLDYEDGVYILEARAWDESGNLGISPSLVVEVKNDNDTPEDRLAPYVWWMAPDAGSTLSDTVDLQVGFYDENEVDSVKVYINGGQRVVIPVQTGIQTGMVEYLWDTHQDSDGVYILEARAWDTSGNLGISPSLMVKVQNDEEPPPEDRTPPVVNWLSPEPGSEVSGDVRLHFEVMDDIGLDSVKVYLNGQEWQKLIYMEEYFDIEVIWITSNYADGNYTVEVRAWDASGNMGIGIGVSLTVRNNVPRVIWVPDDYETIQGAIWESENGDTIMVRTGEYHEQLQFFNKNVSLISESGPEETIIDGTGFYVCAWVTGGQDTNMVIRGFTFINTSEFTCYGISFDGGASPKVYNNIFTSPGFDGRGFQTGQTFGLFRNNLIINCGASGVSFMHSWGDFINNMILHTHTHAFWCAADNGQPLIPNFNLIWDYNYLYREVSGFQWGNHNIVDQVPIFYPDSYRLQPESPGIDQGRPDIQDLDGSRSDIGVYGGPYAYN